MHWILLKQLFIYFVADKILLSVFNFVDRFLVGYLF